MLEFVLKYWIDFLFGLIAAWAVAKINRIQKLEQEKAERETAMLEQKITETLEQKIQQSEEFTVAQDAKLKADIEDTNQNVALIKQGLLSLQGGQFKKQCRILLKPKHVITFEEYEQCVEDHEVYNALGGNHVGDSLFNSVVAKYNAQNGAVK